MAAKELKLMDRVGESAKDLVRKVSDIESTNVITLPIKSNIEDKIQKLGFKLLTNKMDMARKLTLAYAKYLFITEGTINTFNAKLREETLKEDMKAYYYKKLTFTLTENYSEVPPDYVLEALSKAQEDGLFDTYEIARIEDITQVKVIDPILFGRIKGCSDYFFIAQWDDDIRFEDILSLDTDRAKNV